MNTIVLVANGLHTGYVGCYGNEWIQTPALDRFAAEAVVFDQCFADCPQPTAVHRAWWSGRYAFVADEPDRAGIKRDEILLGEHLRDSGVRTALISDNWLLRQSESALSEAFSDVVWIRGQAYDAYVDAADARVSVADYPHLRLPPETHPDFALWKQRWEQYLRNRTRVRSERDTYVAQVIEAGVAWLQQHGNAGPFLLWMECFDPRSPWDPPEPYWDMYARQEDAEATALVDVVPGEVGDVISDEELDRLRTTFAGEVTLVDTWIGHFLEHLRSESRLDETLVVIASGHGAALGEHDWVGYKRGCLYEEMVHVPLMIRTPGGERRGTRSQALVQSPDLLPTLLESLGREPRPGSAAMHGRSLLPLLRGEVPKLRDYAVSGATTTVEGEPATEWAIRTHGWHLILPIEPVGPGPERELYVKPEDRWDVMNVAEQHPGTADQLELVLRRFVHAAGEDRPLEPPPLRESELTFEQ